MPWPVAPDYSAAPLPGADLTPEEAYVRANPQPEANLFEGAYRKYRRTRFNRTMQRRDPGGYEGEDIQAGPEGDW